MKNIAYAYNFDVLALLLSKISKWKKIKFFPLKKEAYTFFYPNLII